MTGSVFRKLIEGYLNQIIVNNKKEELILISGIYVENVLAACK